MKILDITFKGWLQLWRTLFETLLNILCGLLVVVLRGIVKGATRYCRRLIKGTAEHPTGALAGFAIALVLVSLTFVVRSGIERHQTSLMVDSISHVCDSLRNGDRYEAGYSAGVKAMRNRKLESGL